VTPLALTADERARVDRVDALVALGPASVDELVESLEERSWTVRRATVAGLAALGDDAVASLCASLASARSSEHTIAAAADALSTSVGASADAAVATLARHANAAVIEDATRILGRRRAAGAVPLLCELLEHASDTVAVAAIEALGAIGGSAGVEALIAVVRGRNFFRTFPAMQVLARTPDPRVVAPLAELISDELYGLEAVRALGQTGAATAIAPLAGLVGGTIGARTVAVALAELFARADRRGAGAVVREAAVGSLRGSLERFVAALPSGSEAERAAIIAVLGAIGDATTLPLLAPVFDVAELRPAAIAAVQSIVRADSSAAAAALASTEPGIRAAALAVAGAAALAAPARKLLDDDDPEVRARACAALARIGDVSAVPALFARLGDPNPRVALAATAAIHSLGSPETLALALDSLASPSPTVRRHALRVIAYIGPRGAFDAVYAALRDPDRRLAELAVAALGALDDPRVDAAIDKLAGDSSAEMRAAAMRAAGHRGLRVVLERGLADGAAWVRYYACQGLGRTSDTEHALLALVACLADPVPHVRIAALEAVARQRAPEAGALLREAAHSSDPDIRRAALLGIGQRAGDGELDLLLEAVRAPDVPTRIVALDGLARSSDSRALAAVVSAIRDVDLRDAALSLLAERTDRDAIDALIATALASDRDEAVHEALSRPQAERAGALAERLASARDSEADELAAALARMATETATRALFDALAAPSSAGRRAAATALIAIGARGAEAAVRALAASDPDPDVRRACAAAVAR
jgi:HEAT repeat protein